jgi:ADP-heptose:LPS heptosyltransferase
MTTHNLSQAKNVLLISSHRIGDGIFLTPAIAGLRKALNPDTTIDLIAIDESVVEVFKYNPAISHIFITPDAIKLKTLGTQYDAVIALYNNSRTQAYGKDIGVDVIYPEERPCTIHRRDYFVEFISSLFPSKPFYPSETYQLFPQTEHDIIAKSLLLAHGINVNTKQVPLIFFHLGCYRLARQGKKFWQWWVKTGGSKSWPVKSFIELNQLLQKHYPGFKLILTGTEGEKKLAKPLIKSADNIIDLIGKTSILELAALLRYGDAMVTGDTGPMHIACAMNLPLVTLFGPTDPAISGPYPTNKIRTVIYKNDLSDITPEEISAALTHLIFCK